MENTLDGAAGAVSSDQPAVRNAKSAASTFKLVLLWLAVSLPMLWGVMKALQEVQPLFR